MLLPDVRKWRVSALADFATALASDNDLFKAAIDGPKQHFTDLGTAWQGGAYTAAYDRVDADHTQAQKIWTYIDDLVTDIKSAASDVDSHRTVVLAKVGDAEGAGLQVSPDWVVQPKDGVSADIIKSHQDAIDDALHPFVQSVANARTKISAAAELVRSAGDLFGSDLDVSDAPTQGGRLGAQDGQAVADAVKSGDTAKLDEIASHLPAFTPSPDQLAALQAGRDVPDLPADIQDYYKSFFGSVGKDGLLALNQHLDAQAASTDPTVRTVAASEQNALAMGVLAVTNENLGTGTAPDGKLVSAGSYTNLPVDIRQLISGREPERVHSNDAAPAKELNTVRQHYADTAQFADLLSHADPGMIGGRTFSTELGRQAASLADYLSSPDADRSLGLGKAATQLLDVSTRNHEADYQLLTGLDVNTGAKLPDDMSFGALGREYHAIGTYDSIKFFQTVGNHDWGDQGKTLGETYGWTADHIHDQGPEGDLARKTIAALPQVFAPSEIDTALGGGPRLVDGADGRSILEHNVGLFNKNPELANSLSRVIASDIDAFSGVASDGPDATVPLGVVDSNRMLFLASQTAQGRETLDLARQMYDQAGLHQITHDGNADSFDAIRRMAGLDVNIANAERNAINFQQHSHIADNNAQAIETHEDHQRIADTVKGLVDNIPIPGGQVVNTVKGLVEDPLYAGMMDSLNPDPHLQKVQWQNQAEMDKQGVDDFYDRLKAAQQSGTVPISPTLKGEYQNTYSVIYGDYVGFNLITNEDQLKQYLDGGAETPKTEK